MGWLVCAGFGGLGSGWESVLRWDFGHGHVEQPVAPAVFRPREIGDFGGSLDYFHLGHQAEFLPARFVHTVRDGGDNGQMAHQFGGKACLRVVNLGLDDGYHDDR